MKKYITFFFILVCFNSFFAQKKSFVNYFVKPAPLGSKTIEIVYDISLPKKTNFDSQSISGVIDFSLQLINKKNVNNLSAKGEEIAFFIENIVPSEAGRHSSIFTLPNHIHLTDNLPDNKVYRLVNKDDNLILLDSTNPNFESKLPITSENRIIEIGKSFKKSDIDLSFTKRPTKVVRGSSFTLETKILANLKDLAGDPPRLKFEIHIVDKEDVFKIYDLENQRLVSTSNESITVQNGTTNISFKLVAPEIPSDFLPEGRTYRVRLYNDPCCESKAYPFPFELVVTKGNSEKSIFSKRTKVSISPNPVKNYLIVNSTEKSSSYRIYDMSGALVKEQSTLRRIMVSDLKAGVYLLATDSGVTRFTKK